ncbi:MAG: hypothetical protein ACOX2L_07670 [Anaerolineae bacterium]|jgi:hypothetical protein|nr:hypothetical protein [Chloroflexota bacterium]
MSGSRRPSYSAEGPSLLQWLGATALFTVAFLALLQIVGPRLERILQGVLGLLRPLLGGG